jgi:hypothetical protein
MQIAAVPEKYANLLKPLEYLFEQKERAPLAERPSYSFYPFQDN